MARITATFSGVLELYRIGVDSRLKIFWLHFHFPTRARERHAALLTALEEETGWRIYLHPHAHQRALVEAAQRLLPEQAGLTGKKILHRETRTLHLIGTNLPDEEKLQAIARRFEEATGWSLELEEAASDEVMP
jgi:hypothetical protein